MDTPTHDTHDEVCVLKRQVAQLSVELQATKLHLDDMRSITYMLMAPHSEVEQSES